MAATCEAREDDILSRDLQKRYNGLLMIRTKAIKGKGAWYWSHLEPILFQNQETTSKALKLRCGLCNALFSASNPSRTASEHLKRGICPNFNGAEANSNGTTLPKFKFRKHTKKDLPGAGLTSLALIPAPCSVAFQPNSPTAPQLNQTQIETAFNLLAEWFYETCGYVSLSTVNHPKFRAFLHHLGIPPVKPSAILGRNLDIKYVEARLQFEDKIQDAMFFQLSTSGWKIETACNNFANETDALVKVVVNLPNGSSLFHRVLPLGASNPSSDYIREVLCTFVKEVSGSNVYRCAGIVADAGNANRRALHELELHHTWMVNLTCQSKALQLLLKDFFKHLPLFALTASLCHKFVQVNFFKSHNCNDINICLNSQQSLSLEQTAAAISAIENVAQFSGALDQAFTGKTISSDPLNKEISDAIQAPKFWEDLDAVISLTKLLKGLVQEIEEDRPCLGQCLPLWEEVKNRIRAWCNNFTVEEKPVMELVNRRFSKNYHQAWAASYILDPLNVAEDSSGRYLPPFKFLTPEQDKDAVKVITRLTHNENAHIALMELMKWRTEGLDPVYARAVQAKERDQVSGKMKVANPCGSRLVWETYLTEFQVLRKVAARLVFLQASTSGLNWKQPFSSWFNFSRPSSNAIDKIQKILFVSLHKRLEKDEFPDEREKGSMLYNCKTEDIYPTVV
ncbi:hypothetical protein Sjap_005631 [Stephania japonica]|uniref:DUF7963 domain-containing protein n=1 Tax=Stephania japonica TaxID=461633 RepID=A0AAP0K605_9MAGN